jgi:outer membrane protein TolC
MQMRILFGVVLYSTVCFGQHTLDGFLNKAIQNSPVLKEYHHRQTANQIQKKLNAAENRTFHVSLSGDYLFTPYFNNHGKYVTTDPEPKAIGYDINLFDGGLYSAQVSLQRNILNSQLMHILNENNAIQDDNVIYGIELEVHNITKQVTDQYLNAYQSLLLIRLSDDVLTNLNEQLRWTSALLEKGLAKSQDVLLLKIELKKQSVTAANARQSYRSNLCQLYRQCGLQDTSAVTVDSVALPIGAMVEHSNFLFKYRFDSLLICNQQQLFETRYLPQINFFFNTGLNAVELSNIQRKFGMGAGLAMSWPLYDGRQKDLTRQQSQVTQNTIREYRRFYERDIAMQRKDLNEKIQTLQQNIETLNEQIDEFKQLLQLTEKQVQQGFVSMIDYLALLRNYYELRTTKIETEIFCQLEINNLNFWNW